PSDNRESGNGDFMLNLTYLKNILSGISAAFPPHNNTGSSTVTTSKLIKDPRLMKREESLEKQNITGLSEILPFEKSIDYDNSEINLSSVPTNSVSSPEVTSDHTILTNCLDVSCFKLSFDDSQPQTRNTEDHHQTAPNKITMAEQRKDQGSLSFPIYFSNIVSEGENQKHSEEKTQRAQERSNIPLLIKQSSEPHNSYKSVNACTEEYNSYISQEPQSIAQKLMELKLEKTNKTCVSIMTDAFQEEKDIPQAKELLIDAVITSHAIETSLDNSNCNITREYVCVQRKSESEPISLENIQRDFKETPHTEDEGQDHILFYNTQLNNDIYLDTNFKGQGYNDKENENEAEEEDSASSPQNIKNVYGGKKQGFHTNNTLTNISERRDSNYNKVEILSSKEFSTTFNLVWRDKDKSTETALLESEDTKQRDKQNTESVEHLNSITFLELADSSVGEASNATVEIASTSMPTLNTDYEGHQRFEFKDTCFESPDFGLLVKHGISNGEIDMDKAELKDSSHQSINENSVLQSLEFQSEIEIESEQCDTYNHGNVLHEEVEASYEALMSRIDWKGLLGSNNGEMEVLESTTKNENIDQHCSKKICFYSSIQNEELHPILLPDLQVRVTNMCRPGFNPIDDSLVLKDNPYKYMTEATNPEIDEKGETPGFEIDSQPPGENSGYPCEDKFGNSMPDTGITNKYEISHSPNLSHNAHANHVSEKQNSGSLSIKPSNTTEINDECRYYFTKSKNDLNDTKSKKDTDSRISKRKLHASFRAENISHEICGKKRKLTSQDSFKCFSSLSQGRIKIFSQSERHIRSVLDILNSEASLCKSKRLSRTLDKAVLHLKKAHRRVHTSLQLIAKVGEKRKGPLPKAYAIICNSFWESCDLQGYSSVSERRYYSTKHFLPKRKYDKQEEKRTLGFDVNKSLACVSKNKSYKTNVEKIAKCHSKKRVATSVSKSHATIHVSEFYDLEQHPESQLPLFSTSPSTSQSEYNSLRHSESSELHPFSGRTECLLYPDEKLTKKENQIDIKVSNSKYKKLEGHSAHNIKDVTKENSDTNKVINESNSSSLNFITENNLSYNTDSNYEGTCIAHTKVKTDISVSDSNMKHFLNVDIYKQENLLSSGCKRNLEVNVPMDKWTAPIKMCKPNIIIGNFLMGPLNLTSVTNTKYSTPQLLSTTPVTEEGKTSKSYLDKQRIFALDSSTSGTVSRCQQINGEKELLTEQNSSSNSFLIDEDETNDTEYFELDQTSVPEESKSYRENIMNKLPSNGSSLLLKDNIKCSSKKCIAEKDIQDRKIRKIEQAEKEDPVYKTGTTEGLTIKYKNQSKNLKEESSQLNMKKIKSNLVDSHVNIKNTTPEGVSMNNTISGQPNKRTEWRVKVSNDSQPDCISTVGIQGINFVPFLHAQSEACEVTALQKPISYMNELNDKHCSTNHTALIAELSQILQRADETSSLQILEEETKICKNILPSFVEAFEKKQECSLEQILISRELLVEQNLWNNCKYQLKPCAVDTLVELQMVMETIQFIENKKRLLKGEPTFRSLLWYDETLYSELLGRPRGYQLQSSFYPAFQGRLKYNAFCELQSYCNQLFAKTKKKKNSYYVFLKYQRQINECEAILKHCSDCFDFSLSVPFTCGVNCGNSLGDLETLRKSTLKLISKYEDSPKVYTYPGKQDHLWIILDLISSKVKFIKSTEAVTIKISLYGLEHIFFNAAKNLVWKERRQFFSKKYLEKNKDVLLKMNECALSKLQEIHDTLSKDLNSETTSNIELEADTMISFRKSHDLISIEDCRFNSTLFSHPEICYISEILDEAEFADLKKLQELTLRCTDHLEILKKYFQMLQEVNIDNIFITEENVLNVLQNHNHGAVILKPEAVETYIEIVMLSETIHFLKNSMAKKLDNQRFRGMLWFDLSLLPELIRCQEKMASFSFLKENPAECLCNVIETTISELEKNLDIICKYSEAVNCSYALHLFSRELEELSEIKKLLKKSEYCLSTYIDFVPYIASINYGNTVTELEHNYNQFSTLLKNIVSVPQKDLGKIAHIMKVMKTIEHMKIICAKNAKLTTSFILCQMAHNRRNAFQLKREEKMNIHVTVPEENRNKSSPMKVPSISECAIKNFSNSSKKQPITIDKWEDSQEEEKNTISCCKKQKVSMKDVTKIYKEESTFKQPRATRSHPKSENEIESNPSDILKRNYVSPKMVGMQSLLLPLKTLQNTCTSRSESNIDLTDSLSGTSEHLTRQQENFSTIKKRNVSFSVAETKSDKKACAFATCDQRNTDDTFTEDHYTTDPTQKTCLSNINPGTDDCPVPNATMFSKPIFHFLRDIHTNLETNDTVLEHQDNEMLNSSIKNSTCISSPESTCIQGKVSILQENKKQSAKTESEEKYMKNTLKPSTIPFGQAGILTLDANQRAQYSFSGQQDQENLKGLNKKATTYWNELPQSACNPMYNSSEHSFGTSYPYYSWCVYHYSSSNGNSITHTYQGIESYEVYPPPSGILTTVASTVQTTHSNILYSQYFSYFAEQSQANAFMPVNGYFPSQRPVYYNFQQPIFSQYAHQPLPQAAYPYPPNPGVLQEVPWIYGEFYKVFFFNLILFFPFVCLIPPSFLPPTHFALYNLAFLHSSLTPISPLCISIHLPEKTFGPVLQVLVLASQGFYS
ncbi:Testis-expressed sequence 15 protein, partial [Sciurus carolinensis]|nr:Testis-expressed sequence 15 protein [Sciurus carolinensis]